MLPLLLRACPELVEGGPGALGTAFSWEVPKEWFWQDYRMELLMI